MPGLKINATTNELMDMATGSFSAFWTLPKMRDLCLNTFPIQKLFGRTNSFKSPLTIVGHHLKACKE